MKKILFGSTAAICAVVGFSSFKTAGTTTYYWFSLDDSYFPTGAVPTPSAGVVGFSNVGVSTDLTYITNTTTELGPIICGTPGIHWCAVAFTDSQVQQIGVGDEYQLRQTVNGNNTITQINIAFEAQN